MFNWSNSLNKGLISIFIIFSIGVIALVYHYGMTDKSRTVGWKTEKNSHEPFKTGIIINGLPPADFEFSLVEPKTRSPIEAKPKMGFHFLAEIKIMNNGSPNGDIAPTFVFVKILYGKKMYSKIVLNPSAKQEGSYFYSGEIKAPTTTGDYSVELEAEYTIYDNNGGKPKLLEPFRKTLKGITLHVSN